MSLILAHPYSRIRRSEAITKWKKSGGKVQGFLLCLALARERVCMNEALAIERCRSSIQQLQYGMNSYDPFF